MIDLMCDKCAHREVCQYKCNTNDVDVYISSFLINNPNMVVSIKCKHFFEQTLFKREYGFIPFKETLNNQILEVRNDET